MSLFLILTLAGVTALVPFDGDRPACDQAAQFEQARLAALVDPQIRVRCERRGPEHMSWRLNPELRR